MLVVAAQFRHMAIMPFGPSILRAPLSLAIVIGTSSNRPWLLRRLILALFEF